MGTWLGHRIAPRSSTPCAGTKARNRRESPHSGSIGSPGAGGNSTGDAARLQALLREALETLNAAPKDEKFARALLYTFFQPAATQESAAERLGLPFSTYRYHLARGEDRIVEWLWSLELSGSRLRV